MRSPLDQLSEPGLSLSNESVCRAIVEHASTVLLTLIDGTIVDANEAAIGLLGYSLTELRGLHDKKIFDAGYFQFVKQRGGNVKQLIHCNAIRKNGNLLPCAVEVVPLTDIEGQDLISISIIDLSTRVDLSEDRRKGVQDRLENRRLIMNAALEAIICTDAQGLITLCNPRSEKIFGWKEKDVVGKPMVEVIISERDRRQQEEKLKQYFTTRCDSMSNDPIELTAIDFDGREFPVYLTIVFIASSDAEFFCAFIDDLTEKKQAQSELQKAHTQLVSAQQIAKLGYWEFDLVGNSNYWSDQVFEICGLNKEISSPTLDQFIPLLHPEDKDEFIKNHLEALRGTPLLRADYRLVTKDGGIRYILIEASRECNEDGRPVKLLGTLQDITKLKKNELALTDLNAEINKRAEELARSNGDLEQFAYIASHDLQEPLRMVTSFLSLIEKKYNNILDDNGRQYIHFAVDGATRMRRIIQDLLEYSRVGKFHSEQQRIDVNELLQEIVQLNQAIIEEKNAEINWAKLPVVHFSKTLLQQVIHNLLTNALKYQKPNQRPKVEVKSEETSVHWQLSISDNGIGIDPKQHEKIFMLFKRLHSREEYPGTGLGLAICKKIVESYHGHIWVESVLGKGSTFYFTIPKHFANLNLTEG